MTKYQDYDVITARDLSKLITEILIRMQNGWVPIGGVSSCVGDAGWMTYAQAIVKL